MQYKEFWEKPNGVSVSWLALLYVLMAQASFAALGKGEENPDKRGTHVQIINFYRGGAHNVLSSAITHWQDHISSKH